MKMARSVTDSSLPKSMEKQTMNLLKAKYDYKPFPPEELQGKKIFTFVIQDYLLKFFICQNHGLFGVF